MPIKTATRRHSTPLLHWLCKDLNKKLVTLEHDPASLRFKDTAEYIVLHDSGAEKVYGYDNIWKECRPWTSDVSNFDNLSWLESH